MCIRDSPLTRATDEDVVTDVNLYLFGRNNTVSLHKYTTGSRVEFECPAGDYMLYVVVNRHEDLGACREQQLAAQTFGYRENPADLPMSYAGEVTILSLIHIYTQLPDIEKS